MCTYTKQVEDVLAENRRRIKETQRVQHLFPLTKTLSELFSYTNFFVDYEGINFSAHAKKNTALNILDEVFWSQNLETEEIKLENGYLKTAYDGGPVFGKGERPKLLINISLITGDGCYQITTGHELVPKKEWRCLDAPHLD